MAQKNRQGKGQGSGGRVTPARDRSIQSGRYTPPIPRYVRHSPRWYPWLLLTLLLLGVIVIILNYVQVLPASPTNWYTLAGLVGILSGAMLATRYR